VPGRVVENRCLVGLWRTGTPFSDATTRSVFQARTMCDMAGLDVMALKRVRIGGVRLGGLRIGQWSLLPDQVQRMLLSETREAKRGGGDAAAAASGTGAAAGKGEAAGSEVARVPRVKVVQVPRPGKVLSEVVI